MLYFCKTSNMSWRKISSQGVGIGNTIFAPSQTRIFILQDGNTDSHEKASQGVGIEKAVFTSSKRRFFIFFITGQSQKAAECRAARPAERSVHRGLGVPQQADNGQYIYVGTACKRFENASKASFTLFRKHCIEGPRYEKTDRRRYRRKPVFACWDSAPNPLNSPCWGWLDVLKPNAYTKQPT